MLLNGYVLWKWITYFANQILQKKNKTYQIGLAVSSITQNDLVKSSVIRTMLGVGQCAGQNSDLYFWILTGTNIYHA
jgi:hypothetical protein